MRERYCRACGGWHSVEAWPEACFRAEPVARSEVIPTPMIISDGMPPAQHVDGRYYDSKSAFRAVTKREGMVEIGNDPSRLKPPVRHKPARSEIKAAVQKAAARYANGERPQR